MTRTVRVGNPRKGGVASRYARPLVYLGLAGMLIGAVDPLEGSIVILAGTGVAAVGALLARSPQATRLLWALPLVGVGVAVLFGLSAVGGIGGASGWSNWWGLLLVPYPVGWVLGLVAVFRTLREKPTAAVAG